MLKKLKDLTPNFALIAFLAFTVKMLVFTASFPDALIMGVLAGLYGYTQYLKRFQPYTLDEAVRNDLIEVKTALAKLKLAGTVKQKEGYKF